MTQIYISYVNQYIFVSRIKLSGVNYLNWFFWLNKNIFLKGDGRKNIIQRKIEGDYFHLISCTTENS